MNDLIKFIISELEDICVTEYIDDIEGLCESLHNAKNPAEVLSIIENYDLMGDDEEYVCWFKNRILNFFENPRIKKLVENMDQIDYFKKMTSMSDCDIDVSQCQCCSSYGIKVLKMPLGDNNALLGICRNCVDSIPWPNSAFKSRLIEMTNECINSINWN